MSDCFRLAPLMLIVANAFLAVLLAGVVLADLVRLLNELYPFPPLGLAKT